MRKKENMNVKIVDEYDEIYTVVEYTKQPSRLYKIHNISHFRISTLLHTLFFSQSITDHNNSLVTSSITHDTAALLHTIYTH